jgi:hypothetical protein
MDNRRYGNYPALLGIHLEAEGDLLAIEMLDLAENLFED